MPASGPRTWTRSCSAISTAASRRRTSPPRSCSRRATSSASSPRPASRTPARPARPPCIRRSRPSRRSAPRIVLVVGVEQMTRTPGPEIGNNLLKASYLPEDGDTPGGFAGVFGKIAGAYFQRYGDQSDALALIAAKNHKNGVDNPYAQMRKDLGFEFCRAESEKNPFVAGPLKRTDCSLVSDGAAALVLADTETALQHEARRRLPGDGPCAGFPADVEARHPPVRRLRRSLAARARAGRHRARRSLLRRDARLLHHRRAHRIRGHGPDARAGRARRRSRKAGRRRTAGCR